MRLHKLKNRDLRLRFDRGEISCTKTKKKVKKDKPGEKDKKSKCEKIDS